MRHEDAVSSIRSVYQKEKHMKQVKEDIRYLVWFVLVVVAMLLASGCGKKTETDTIVQTENCTVFKSGTDAVIECPDGSSVTVPATVINNEIITIRPVVIQVPKNRCNRD
jgi:hypothetical protein